MRDGQEDGWEIVLAPDAARTTLKALELYSRLACGQLSMIAELAADGHVPVHDPEHGPRKPVREEMKRIEAGVHVVRGAMGYSEGTYLSMDASIQPRAKRCWEIEKVLEKAMTPDAPVGSYVEQGLWRRIVKGPAPEASLNGDGTVTLHLDLLNARSARRALEVFERVCRVDMGVLVELMNTGEMLGFENRTMEPRSVPKHALARIPFMVSALTDPFKVPRREAMPLDDTASDAAHVARAVRTALSEVPPARRPDDGAVPRCPVPEARPVAAAGAPAPGP